MARTRRRRRDRRTRSFAQYRARWAERYRRVWHPSGRYYYWVSRHPTKNKRRRATKRRWVQRAVKRRGALHHQLGIPAGKKIPLATLRRAAKAGGKLGKRARLALVMRKFKHKRKRSR